MSHDDKRSGEAAGWASRADDPAFDDWDGLTAWLEEDPGNAERYDHARVAASDAADALARSPRSAAAGAAPLPRTARVASRAFVRAAIAASLAAAVGLGWWTQRPQPYAIVTAAGEQRAVRLDDGSSIAMSGGTKVLLDRRDARKVELASGEASFDIRHDASRPFAVLVSGVEVRDIGTVFDVKRSAGLTRVAVASGEVMYDPDGASVRLTAGRALEASSQGVTLSRVNPADVSGWREGRLTYDGASVAEIAGDLERALGRRVVVEGSAGARRFTGTLSVNLSPELLGPLLGVRIVQRGTGWVMTAR